MRIDPLALVTILGMAVATYLTRISGFWLMGRITPTPRVEAWMRAIPGAVLISLVAPALVTGGWITLAGAALTIVIAVRTGKLLPALVAGVALVAVLRAISHTI